MSRMSELHADYQRALTAQRVAIDGYSALLCDRDRAKAQITRLRAALRLVILDADQQDGERWCRIRASTELACRQALLETDSAVEPQGE
ncbi:MAG: hypothetical protein IT514_15490 [Burkholderiales bacterium]|nr:hypothetical protein [Burkholderiales bacterium]